MKRHRATRTLLAGLALALAVVACAPAETADTTSRTPVTATTSVPATSTAAPSTTISTPTSTDPVPPPTSSTTTSSMVPSEPSFPVDPELVWTVIAVELDDILNVRAEPDPDAEIVGTLEPWATEVAVSIESSAGDGVWRRVVADNGTEGWANARFLVAQPAADDPDGLADSAAVVDELVSWVRNGDGAVQDHWFASRALWFGGLGIFSDGASSWDWIPTTDLDRHSDWTRTRRFLFAGEDCGSECRKSLSQFLRFDRLDSEFEILIDDLAPPPNLVYVDGFLGLAPKSLHRIVVDKPAPDPSNTSNWQRIHFVFDWSSGDPRLSLIQTWGWTP